MKWIIQDNLFKEEAVSSLIEILDKRDLPYELVKVIPFTDGELSPDPDIENGESAIVVGSGTLNKYAFRKSLMPGAWTNDDFKYTSYIENYGNRMLNYSSVFLSLSEVMDFVEDDEEYFIRPDTDGKVFAGEVLKGIDIIEWFEKILRYDSPNLDANTIVMISPLQNIYNENRFVVVDGKVITGSQYKLGSQVKYSKDVDQDIYDYAQECVDIWQPADVFVIDIARTDEGLRCIEINNFNSAGWYHCDVAKIVESLENRYG